MVRTQIQLTERQIESLRSLADQTGRSMADLIRESVDSLLSSRREPSREERVRRALAAVGKFSSGESDIAERHDDYLNEIYGS